MRMAWHGSRDLHSDAYARTAKARAYVHVEHDSPCSVYLVHETSQLSMQTLSSKGGELSIGAPRLPAAFKNFRAHFSRFRHSCCLGALSFVVFFSFNRGLPPRQVLLWNLWQLDLARMWLVVRVNTSRLTYYLAIVNRDHRLLPHTNQEIGCLAS